MRQNRSAMNTLFNQYSYIYVIEFSLWIALSATHWLPSPQRDHWVFLLIPAIILSTYDFVHKDRSETLHYQNRLAFSSIALLLLYALSIYTAPFTTRGWILLYRPAIGLWMVLRFPYWWQERAARTCVNWVIAGTALLVFIMGFTAIQWTGKAAVFASITDHFPRWQDFAAWPGGFNPNEWAGAAAWIAPALFALIRYRVVTGWRAAGTTILFAALTALLFLSQSLSGIAGASIGVMFALVPLSRLRWAMAAGGALLLIGNLAVLLAPTQSADVLAAVSGRPSVHSLEHRAVMWERANHMLADHPWTGVGIALYRSLRAEYPTPGYEHVLLPHPHNEALQFATDLGIPGLIVFGWIVLSVGLTARRVMTVGSRRHGAMAAALCAGLLSHAVFGLTDAIPIWDRFAILGWGMLALLAAVERAATAHGSSPD